jgi:DsbC/DsbD-like thiol-disulfide interchange protein
MEHILDMRQTKVFMLGMWRIVLFCAVCLTWPALAEPKTHIHLILSAETAQAGDTIWAGLKMDMPYSWHVYWRNGGDAG